MSGTLRPASTADRPSRRSRDRATAATWALVAWEVYGLGSNLWSAVQHGGRSYPLTYTRLDFIVQILNVVLVFGTYAVVVSWRRSFGGRLATALVTILQIIVAVGVAVQVGHREVYHDGFSSIMVDVIFTLLTVGPLLAIRYGPQRRRPNGLRSAPPPRG